MTDHDPFGPAGDEKTVQYAKGGSAAPTPDDDQHDDDKTVQYDRSASAAPTPADDDKTVQYQTVQPAPASQTPPPIWVSTGERATGAPPPRPAGPPPGQSWQPSSAPPSWFPAVPGQAPPASNNRRWWFIGGGIAAAVVVIAVVVTIVVASSTSDGPNFAAPTTTPSTTEAPSATTTESPSTTTSTPPASTGPDDLAGLLESASDVSDRLESPGMTASPVSTDLISGITVTPDNCAGAWTPGLSDTYAGSGYTGAALQMVRDPGQNNHQVNQAIVSFADDAAAKAFYDQQVAAWQGCNYQKISAAAPGVPTVTGTAAVSADTEGTTDMLILVDNWPGGGAIQCQRAITNRTNVVVDVLACSPSVGSAGWTIARDIGQKITGQR
jgi:hypothetical protein